MSSSPPIIHSTARVRVTVEVDCTQPWDSCCTLKQLFLAAEKEACNVVLHLFEGKLSMRIIEVPRVEMVQTYKGR